MTGLRFFAASALVLLASVSARAADAAGAKAGGLKPALDQPMSRAMDALDSLHEQVQTAARGGNVEPLLRHVERDKRSLKADLKALRAAPAGADDGAVRDAAVVAVAQGLRAAELVGAGLLNGDNGQAVTGVRLAGLAYGTLKRLRESGATAGAAGAAGAASSGPNAIGRCAGFDLSFQGQNDSDAMNLGLNLSFPATKAIDYGLGTTLTFNSSSSSGGGSSEGFTWGLNAFTRYHFLGLFPSAGWIVPYVGLEVGLNTNVGSQVSSGDTTLSSGDSVVLGGLLGTLFFVNPKTAVSLQLELADNVTSSTQGLDTTTSSYGSELLTIGINEMF